MDRLSSSFALRPWTFAALFLAVLSHFAYSAQPSAAVVAAVEANAAAVTSAKEIARSDSAALLKDEIAKADAEIAQARIAGNTTRQARAQTLRKVCEKALETLESTGDAAFPDTIRREIRPTVASIAERLSKIRDRRDVSLGAAEKVLHNAVRDVLLSEALPATESDIAAAIAAARDAKPDASPGTDSDALSTDAAGEAGNAMAEAAESSPASKTEPLASSGRATGWAPLLRVSVKVQGIEIVSIPVVGVRQPRAIPLDGISLPTSAQLDPVENVLDTAPPGPVPFRAFSVEGSPAPDILEWPSPNNGWRAQIRCRPGEDPEVPVQAVFEVAANAIGLRSLSGGEVASATSGSVSVHVESRPSGATVLVNGEPVPNPDGKALATPCDIPLPPSGATLELRLAGFLPAVFNNVQSNSGKRITATLVRDPDYIDRVMEVRPNVVNSLAGVILKQGRRYRLSVEGTWSCDPGKTPTDWRGYAPDKYPGLYAEPARHPRLTDEANVGALVFSTGKGGSWRALPDGATLAPKNTGPIRFDINEGGGAKARVDNTGLLRVRIRSL